MTEKLRFVPCGDRSLLVYIGEQVDPDANQQVHGLARALGSKPHPAVAEVTPGYHCLMVEFDPVRIRWGEVEELVRTAFAESCKADSGPTRLVEIPVLYGSEAGPDLAAVAAHTGLSPAEVVRRHAMTKYRVYCLGFSPGFCYLGPLDPALKTPRRADPRTQVEAGSVGIGGEQTGIYPTATPGGWQIIGQTPLRLFDPRQEPPALLHPGDEVRLRPVAATEFTALAPRERPLPVHLPAYTEGKTGLKILRPGLATTLQDLGRRGFMAYGVPMAGAVDFISLMIGNWLLGNRARTAALEITVLGPEVEFTGPVAFCLTGAPIPAELVPAGGGSPRPVPGWTALLAGPGDRLRMGSVTSGCRAYLGVGGGFDLAPVLGSLSEDLFGKIGPLGRPLQSGDWLPTGLPVMPPAALAGRSVPADLRPVISDCATVRVTRGPQASAFAPLALSMLCSQPYTVGERSDRQGLRLQGTRLLHAAEPDILSEPVPPGSIQVPGDGQPILLLNNRQPLGGYAKLAVAIYPDLAGSAQLRPGATIGFQEVDLSEAHQIAWAERRKLAQVRRVLEREMGYSAPPAFPELSKPQAPGLPTRSRTFRITVAGITYEAEVEEIS